MVDWDEFVSLKVICSLVVEEHSLIKFGEKVMRFSKYFLSILVIGLIFIACTKEIERIYYRDNAGNGKIVGLVEQKNSQAVVYIRQGMFTDSTVIDQETGAFEFDSLQTGNYDVLIIAAGYGTYKTSDVIVLPNSVAYIGEISLPKLPDLIHSHYPDDRAEIPITSYSTLSIIINFMEPMNRESVQQAFSTEPPSEGVFYWSQSIYDPYQTWYRGWDELPANPGDEPAEITTYTNIRCMKYIMRKPYVLPDVDYTAILSASALDSAGNFLSFPLEFSFQTIETAYTQTGILTDPENGSPNVSLSNYHSLYVLFPKRMDQESVEQAFNMKPKTDVIFLWPKQNQLKIYTGGPLKADTTYEITIAATARDLDGVNLDEPFHSSFQTELVRITSTTPQNGQVFVELDARIYLQFNTYIIPSTLVNAFSTTPAVNGSFVWNSNSQVYFEPSQNYLPYTKYTVEVNTSAADYWGTALKEPVTFSFATKKP